MAAAAKAKKATTRKRKIRRSLYERESHISTLTFNNTIVTIH